MWLLPGLRKGRLNSRIFCLQCREGCGRIVAIWELFGEGLIWIGTDEYDCNKLNDWFLRQRRLLIPKAAFLWGFLQKDLHGDRLC